MNGARGSMSKRLWRRAAALGLLALACGILLGGLSAWFLGSVALAGLSTAALAFNFHIPGALVRLFALGRTAARYGERLIGHKAALTDQSDHRVVLFSKLASSPSARRAGWQLADQARLTEYIDDVEDIDFAALRADLPAGMASIGTAGALLATAFVAPLALLPIAGCLALLVVASLDLERRAQSGLRDARSRRRDGAALLGAAMGSAVPLQGEGRWAGLSREALDLMSRVERAEHGIRLGQARVDALAGSIGPVAALGVVVAAWLAGARGGALMIPAFLGFSWIALGEALQGCSRIVVARLRRRAAQEEMAERSGEAAPTSAGARSVPTSPARLRHARLQRRAPDGRPLGQPIALTLQAGRPTILSGASGIGKTSLLKQIAGWLGDGIWESDTGPLDAGDRCRLAMICLHDAAILADTVRANLFADDLDDGALWRALDAVELADRIRAGGGLYGWITQGSLSLGEAQRLNLARAWLSRARIVLLDEPTEHLPRAQAARIMTNLVDHLQDRIVVIGSHARWDAQGASIHLVSDDIRPDRS